MNRKIRFRQQRIYKLKIMLIALLFITVLFSGLLAVDINKNSMLYGQPHVDLIQIELLDNDIYNVSVLNNKFSINLKYLKRDLNNLKEYFSK